MKSNYDPSSRSFKYMCMQNQMAHCLNRSSVKSRGNSNIYVDDRPKLMVSAYKSMYLKDNQSKASARGFI